ncbi:MAG: DUF4349 domain-containing protein, partial [Actinomycetota bacterium]|nr:DUF4349 domain-containing protein [Actinomycetota bacterium]
DAQIESDLRVIDEALERGTVTAAEGPERELEQLVADLASDPPKPDAVFAARLGERVRAGFLRPRRAPHLPRPGLPKLRRPPMVALAGAASILAAVAVVISLQGSEGRPEITGLGDGAADTAALPERSAASGRAAPEAAIAPDPPVSPGGGFVPGAEDRRIERSASLTLAAPDDRLEDVANDIVSVTDRHDGFVLRSSISSGEEGASAGDFELRIPAGRLQPALRDLSELGDVRARTQAGQDITGEFVSAADRLQAARAERRSLLTRLESAETDIEAESIRRRLDLVAAEVNGLRGQLRDLRLRSDYATVAVTLERTDDEGGSSSDESGRGGLGGALDDAVESLSDSVELLVRVLGVALAPALLAALLWLGARTARQRRREAALD